MSAIKCLEEDKTTSLFLLLDVNSFEASKHLGIKSDTEYSVAKQKLKDYFSITETKEELRDKLDLRFQEAGETIEAYARDINLIGHKAYPNGDPDLLENILINVCIHGLRDDMSRERVLLYSPQTLTEAAQYARFSEAAVRVTKNRGAPTTASTVNSMNYRGNFNKRGRGRGSSNSRGRSFSRGGFRQGTDRGRQRGQSHNPSFGNRNFSSNGRGGNCSSRGQKVRCFNCNKMGHMAKNCWAPKRQASRGRGGGQAGRFQNRVSAVGNALPERQQEERDTAGASGYTANGINAIPTRGHRASPFHRMRKLCGVPGKINETLHSQLLVDYGSPVTIIRSDFWKQVRDPTEGVEEEPEDFQGVTQDGLRVVGLTRLDLSLWGRFNASIRYSSLKALLTSL